MTKLQKTLQRFYEWYNTEADQNEVNIWSFIGWLEGAKVLTKEEADFLLKIDHNYSKYHN